MTIKDAQEDGHGQIEPDAIDAPGCASGCAICPNAGAWPRPRSIHGSTGRPP